MYATRILPSLAYTSLHSIPVAVEKTAAPLERLHGAPLSTHLPLSAHASTGGDLDGSVPQSA